MTLGSDFALRVQLSQSVHNVGEGGPLLEAQSPAASHELVDSGGTSIGGGQLQLPRLQSWRGERGRRDGSVGVKSQ